MSGFQALNTAYTGMRAAQAALSTVSHNVANVGTEGYTRQRVNQSSLRPYDATVGTLGAGVDVDSITRRRDSFLDARVRSETGIESTFQRRSDLLQRTEALFGSTQDSVSDQLAATFAAFEDLALHPENAASREVARTSLEAFAGRLNTLADGMGRLEESVVMDIDREVAAVNDALHDVARMNAEIATAGATGNPPNDLMDTRDRKLDELATLVGVTISHDDDLTVRVTIDGLALVDGASVYELGTEDGVVTHPHGAPDLGGALEGTRRFLDQDIGDVRSALDDFAVEIRDAFNGANARGFIAAGVPGPPLLGGGDAATLALAIGSGDEIATAGSNPPAAFDGTNAQAIADLRSVDLPTGRDPLATFQELLTDVAARTSAAMGAADRQASVATAATIGRESQHGVVLDEEMASLVQYQRAIEAAARVMSTIDEAMGTIIQRMGRVGI